ncbi:MAG: PEP-CTERM sorting domain-containing protein, partial [Pirellula sp.]
LKNTTKMSIKLIKSNHLSYFVRSIACAFLVFMVAPANASFQLDFGTIFNGGTPTGPAPWLTATFTDTMTEGQVQLTLTSNLPNSIEYIDQVGFNSTVTISTFVSAPVSSQVQAISFGSDNQSVSGAGAAGAGFDALINFKSANAERFNLTESITFLITGAGLTENSFNSTNSSLLFAAAHFAGLPNSSLPSGSASASITAVPEPSSFVFGIALSALGYIGIRRRRKKTAI